MPGKITVKNFSTLTEYSALFRAALYLTEKKEDAEKGGFHFKVRQDPKNGLIVKITEDQEVGIMVAGYIVTDVCITLIILVGMSNKNDKK